MKALVFDTGPIISLTLNNLLGLLTNLKPKYKGYFYITPAIRDEVIDRPLNSKKFKFEALQVLRSWHNNILEVFEDPQLNKKTNDLMDLANQCFEARGNYIHIVHFAEISGVVATVMTKAEAFVVDERTTRLLIEHPERLRSILSRKLHTSVTVNKKNLRQFLDFAKGVKLIRSAELVTIAYELGLLDKYIVNIPNPKKTLLEAVLWAVKLNGCAISEREVVEIIKMETKSQSFK
ncbi:MAG: hypothetical protein U9O94_11270 [Nanoarchaeota archaeon]|nr:hypothetical protein [Nanoarchaeota archaeon]